MHFNRRYSQMNAAKNRAEKLILSSPGRAPVGALLLRALPSLLICVHLRPSAVQLFLTAWFRLSPDRMPTKIT
jgi:hypothetical protein